MNLRALFWAALGQLTMPSLAHAESVAHKLEVIGGNLAVFGVVGLFLAFTGAIPIQFYFGFMMVLASVLIISSGLVWTLFAICGGIAALFFIFWIIRRSANKTGSYLRLSYPSKLYTTSPFPKLSFPSISAGTNYSSCSREYGPVNKILWHGTPSVNRALDILQGAGTWVVGSGNVNGSGVYISSMGTAKGYAGPTGALVKLQLAIQAGQVVYLDDLLVDPNFSAWKRSNRSWNAGDAITEYAVSQLGKRYLKVSDDIWVALAHKTNGSHYVSFRGIKALGVYDLRGNQIA